MPFGCQRVRLVAISTEWPPRRGPDAFTLREAVISCQWLDFSNGCGKRSFANAGVNGQVAPKAPICTRG